MSILHMETDTVRSAADQQLSSIENIREQMQTVYNAVHNLDWQGPARDQFEAAFANLYFKMFSSLDTGSGLGNNLLNEVTEWESIANQLHSESLGTLTSLNPLDSSYSPERINTIFEQYEEGLLDFADLSEIIHKGITTNSLGIEDGFVVALKILKFANVQPELERIIQNADDVISLKNLITAIATDGAKANPGFALAWFVSKHETWTPYVDQFAENARQIINQVAIEAIQNDLPKALDLIDVATYQMDSILGYATPEQEKKYQEVMNSLNDTFSDIDWFQFHN